MTRVTLSLLNVVFLLAAIAAWPIYQDRAFVVLVLVSLTLANTLVLVAMRRGWSSARLAAYSAVSFLALGVPLAIPSGLSSPAAFMESFLALIVGVVTSWKDLLTLSLPVGSYQAVLLPAFIMFFVVPLVALSIALRSTRSLPIAAGIAALPLVFAATFGSSATSTGQMFFGLRVPALSEITLTLGSVLLLMIWVTRRSAQQVKRTHSRERKRLLPAILTLTAGVLTALVLVPPLMQQVPRDVLRTQIDPQRVIDEQLSPLSLYRAALSDELFDTTLFQVSGGEANRIRIATLSGYDGQVVTVGPESFARVPALLSPNSDASSTSITIDALQGIWMPTISDLSAITFTGDRRTALTDGFFANESLGAGIQIADGGLRSGDSFRLASASLDTDEVALSDLQPGLTQPRIDPALVPESLQDWLALQRVPRTGQGLETLIDRLRARGYLSHSLSIDAANPPEWMLALPGYRFEPSRSGHSSARIDQLFTELRDRQRELGNASDADLVAAVGDDEQFAVAAMLLADQLGFNARIVLGTALQAAEGAVVPECSSGECTGANLSAWLEVQGDSGRWVAVDVTPQFEIPISPEVERLQDPQIVTEVQPPSADAVQPPNAAPSQRDADDANPEAASADLTWLWRLLQVLGLALVVALIVGGPFAVIMLLKHLRRQSRVRAAEPKEAVLGAWNEFVDGEVDAGGHPPTSETRIEFVTHHIPDDRQSDAQTLAVLVDRAVFSDQLVAAAERDRAWQIVGAQQVLRSSQLTRRKRARAALSLRSFKRWMRGGR